MEYDNAHYVLRTCVKEMPEFKEIYAKIESSRGFTPWEKVTGEDLQIAAREFKRRQPPGTIII